MKLGEKIPQGSYWTYVGRMTDNGEEYDLFVSSEDEEGVYTWVEACKKFKGSLPTAKELHLIGANVDLVPNIQNDEWYWASTEYITNTTNNFAWSQRISDGHQCYNNKSNTCFVRCVRRINYENH